MERVAYTLDEVAELTGISVRRLQDGCRLGEIPHTVYRGQRVMTRDQIERFLASNETGPGRPAAVPELDKAEKRRQRARQRIARIERRAAS